MRVVTTWFYFDDSQVYTEPHRSWRGEKPDPGVGVAWFAGNTADMLPVSELKLFQELPGREKPYELNVSILKNYLDLFLLDSREFEFDQPERSLKNERIADSLLTEQIVIERSPPIHVTLKGLINSTNLPLWIGTYMGWRT